MTTGKIVTLQDGKNGNIYPETSASAVYLNDGKTLEEGMITYRESDESVILNNPDIMDRINGIENDIYTVEKILDQISYSTRNFGIFADGNIYNIQSIINNISKNGGGTLIFDKGEYILEPFTIMENVMIKGQGCGGAKLNGDWFNKPSIGTILKCTKTSKKSFVSFDRAYGASLTDVSIDGNISIQDTAVNGVEFISSEEYKPYNNTLATIENCEIINCSGNGIEITATYGQIITNSMIRDNALNGVKLSNATDNTFINLKIFRNDKCAVLTEGNCSHNFFIGGKWYQNNVLDRDKGQLSLINGSNIHFTNIDIQDSFGHGVFIDSCNNITFNGCSFDTSGYTYKTDNNTKWDVGNIDRACVYLKGDNYLIDFGNSIVMNYLSGEQKCKYGIYSEKRGIGKIGIDNVLFAGGVEIPKTNVYTSKKDRINTTKFDDFDLYIEEGTYFISRATSIPNCPPLNSMYGILNVYTENGNINSDNNLVIIQQYIEEKKCYIRKRSNNVWSEWVKLLDNASSIIPSYTGGHDIGSRDLLWREMWAQRAFFRRNGDNLWLIASDSSTNVANMRFMTSANVELGSLGINNTEFKLESKNTPVVLNGTEVKTFCNIKPSASAVLDLGDDTRRWRYLYLNNSPNISSKRELKENIEDVDLDKFYEVVKGLKPHTYNFKDDTNKTKKLGYILDEVPQDIQDNGGLDLYALISYLGGALTKAIEKIEILENKIK